jgi:hypothetical protein
VEKRIFKNNKSNIYVYMPTNPEPQIKISTLCEKSNPEYLTSIFNQIDDIRKDEIPSIVDKAEQNTEIRLTTFPRRTLEKLLEELEESLELSVGESFLKYINSTEKNIETESIMRELIKKYNNAAKRCRRLLKKSTEQQLSIG